METTKNIIIAFALLLFVTPAAISEESQISNTRQASCVVQITINEELSRILRDTIMPLVHSTSVFEKAAREVIESPLRTDSVQPSLRTTPTSDSLHIHTLTLDVTLPDNVKPAAKEFITALVDNLRESLNETYEVYRQNFTKQLAFAQQQYHEAESQLNEATENTPKIAVIPIDTDIAVQKAVQTQLEQIVDLSDITPETSFAEIIDRLRNSVDPPLQIQPNWRDLYDTADIDRETPAEMDPISGIKLGKALDVLLEGLSITDVAELDYIVDDGVITIATKDKLGPQKMVTYLYDISGFLINGRTSGSFIYAIEETIEPESWYDISEEGEGNIVDMLGGKISVYNTPEIQEKLTNFLANFPIDSSDESIANVPVETLLEDKQGLERQRRQLELEVARLEARQMTAEQQIIAVSGKVQNETSVNELNAKLSSLLVELENLKRTRTAQHPEIQAVQKRIDEINEQIAAHKSGDTVTVELEQLIENHTKVLDKLKEEHEALVANGYEGPGPSNVIIEAEEKLARLKIELARRREELARPAGVGSLGTLNENLSMALLDLAEKKAELQVVEKQLSEIEGQIRAASTTDPNILKIRQAKQALERAEKRLNELKEIEENLQPPQVIAIGIY